MPCRLPSLVLAAFVGSVALPVATAADGYEGLKTQYRQAKDDPVEKEKAADRVIEQGRRANILRERMTRVGVGRSGDCWTAKFGF